MPTVRALLALTLTAGVFVVDWSHRPIPAGDWLPAQVVITSQRTCLLVAGLAVAILGAWSRKGAHRRLIQRQMESALLGLGVLFAAITAGIGIASSIDLGVEISASAAQWAQGSGVGFVAQLPILAAGVIAAVFHHGGDRRACSLALSIGLAISFLVHEIARIRYDDWSGPALGCQVLALVLFVLTLAGTATPLAGQPRQVPPRTNASGLGAVLRLLLGGLSLLPLASAIACAFVLIQVQSQGSAESRSISQGISGALWPAFAYLAIAAPLVVAYAWHVLSRARIESGLGKLAWIVLLVFAAPFAMPVYWYAHVWSPRSSSET